MASLVDIQERVDELSRRHRQASDRKSKLSGKLDEKKLELLKLSEEVKAAGFDPKNLKAEKERLEKELETLMDQFEDEITKVEEALDEYEK